MTYTEQDMLDALDGKFYSFTHESAAGTKILCMEVPIGYTPKYNFMNQFQRGSAKGGKASAAQQEERAALVWTPENAATLKRYRLKGYGAKKIHKIMGISRGMVLGQIRKMEPEYRLGRPKLEI